MSNVQVFHPHIVNGRFELSPASWFFYIDTVRMSAAYENLNEQHASKKATSELAGEIFALNGNLVTKWDASEVSKWLVTIGYNDLVPLFHQSNINGAALTRLDDRLLKEIGVLNVGTRLQFLNEVIRIQAISRAEWRNHIVWTGEEYRPPCCCFMLPWSFPCCCAEEICCGKRAQYTLTNGRLNILRTLRPWCGILTTMCFGWGIVSDNIDLTLINDIDCAASTHCMGDPLGFVSIQSFDGTSHTLHLASSEVQKVTATLNNAKEEAVVTTQILSPPVDL